MRRRALIVVLAVATAVVAAGCGNSEDDVARTMTVVGTEMAFVAPERVVEGHYQVTFRNEGAEYHELAFTDAEGRVATRMSIPGGEEVVLEVDLDPGTWELGCFEPGHYEAGMFRSLEVTPA